MAITKTRLRDGENYVGKFKSTIYDITFDSSYLTGGESIVAKDVGLTFIYGARILGYKDTTSGGYEIKWDYDSLKLMAFRSAGFTPAGTNGTSAVTGTAAAQTFTGSALGTHTHTIPAGTDAAGGTTGATSGGTPAGTNASSALTATAAAQTFTGTAVAAGALVEVANGVNLTTVTVRVEFIGLT